jgi:putative Mg2+ transporter-C (MgtC) family protein
VQFFDTVQWKIFLDVLLASGLTFFIGFEREKAHKAAGMRTHMIVGGFTCLIILLSSPLMKSMMGTETVEADPIRIIQAVVIGISFIGAGTILKDRNREDVVGLTTAATLLYSCGIGVCVALEYYSLAIALTLLILLVNYVLRVVATKFSNLKSKRNEKG